MQGDAVPGEGQQSGRVVGRVRQQVGVHGRVEEGGVQAEVRRLVAGRTVECDLGEHVVAAPPRRAQALEGGAVGVAALAQPPVGGLDVDRGGAGRRPLSEVEGGFGSFAGQGAVGMPGPRGGGVRGRARVDADRAGPGGVRGADDDSQGDAAPGRQYQRGFEEQFLDPAAADVVARPDRQLHETGARQQHTAQHAVVREPRLGAGGEPPGEDDAPVVRRRHGGAQQGWVTASRPAASRSPGAAARSSQ